MTSARERSSALAALLRQEQHAMADFLLALAQFDAEKVWQQLGHASLFSYLRAELKLSAGAAQYRKTAADLIRRYPAVERALRAGDLCLSSITELNKVLEPENEAEVLPRFFGLSRREAAAVAVSIVPVEDAPVREVVTMLRTSSASVPAPSALPLPSQFPSDRALRPAEMEQTGSLARSVAQPNLLRTSEIETMPLLTSPSKPVRQPEPFRPAEMEPGGSPAQVVAPPPAPHSPARCPAPPPPPVSTDPLSADLARLHINVTKAFLDKLDQARDALAHAIPGASAAHILEAGLDLLLKQRDQRRATGRKPAAKERTANPDTITAEVRRAVWMRDQGRCQFPLEGGGVCGSTYRLELDHIQPKALGGQPTVDGLRVACRPHNQLAARRVFGDAFIDGKIRERRRRTTPHELELPGGPGAGTSCGPRESASDDEIA